MNDFVVIEVEKNQSGSKLVYLISDTRDGSLVGKAIVNYHHRQAFWYYISTKGRKIKTKATKQKMADAVTRCNDEIGMKSEAAPLPQDDASNPATGSSGR